MYPVNTHRLTQSNNLWVQFNIKNSDYSNLQKYDKFTSTVECIQNHFIKNKCACFVKKLKTSIKIQTKDTNLGVKH